MRPTKPEVFLISAPSVDWNSIRNYLSTIEADSWADRVENSDSTDAESLVEFGGRLCYRSWEPGLNANVTRVREDSKDYHLNVLRSGHGSVLEHANFSYVLHNVSRVVTHEMVRHRAGAAYSQESMRFVRLVDIPFWFPEWAEADPELMNRSIELLHRMESHQTWMAEHFGLDDEGVPFSEKKAKTSFMRRFAPIGVSTGMLATFNMRTIRHIVYMRSSLGAEEEIRIVADEIAELALEAAPNLMQDYSPNENGEWIPEFLKV